jgi:hypothetical protein
LAVKTRGLLLALITLLALVAAASAAARARPLTAAERASINHALDVFVNHAVKRQNVGASYWVVTPNLRGGMTRKMWSGGSLPVYPYPARGTTFHDWTFQYRNGNELGIQLFLMPRRGSKYGAIAWLMTLTKLHGHWLVDSFLPGATFAPEGKQARVIGTNDFTPGTGGDALPRSDHGRISGDWALIPFAVLALAFLMLAGWAVLAGIRHRLARQEGNALPPLPRGGRRRTQPGA